MTKKKAAAEKKKTGRKSKWDELEMNSKIELVEFWSKMGYTHQSMCESLGISHDTFYQWVKTKPEFSDALKRGKEFVNKLVVNKLIERATGNYVTEEETEDLMDESGTVINSRVKKKKRYIAPSDTAIIFWLKNNMPDHFKDKVEQDHNHSGEVEFVVSLDDEDED